MEYFNYKLSLDEERREILNTMKSDMFGHCNNSGKELQIKKLVFLLMKLVGPPNCLIWTQSATQLMGVRCRHKRLKVHPLFNKFSTESFKIEV